MLNWPVIIVCAVGISMLLTLLVIPQILHISLVKRLFDRPNNRKVHNGIVPRLGGFAFLPVIFLTLGIITVLSGMTKQSLSGIPDVEYVADFSSIAVLATAMLILFLIGLADDLIGLKYGAKFIGQFLSAILIVAGGYFIVNYTGIFGITQTSMFIGAVITVFLIIFIINSLNLIDGIDGLAAGISLITLGFYGITLYSEGQYLYSLLSWTAVGSIAVFWVFNVFGSKKKHTKIFMGDIGSLTLGVFIAFMSVSIAMKPQASSLWTLNPLVVALSPLVLPLLDVLRVFCVRIFNGTSPFLPDKRHIHHILLTTGMPMRMAMVMLILWQTSILLINLWLASYWGINWILLIDIAIYIVGLLLITLSGKKLPKNNA